MRSPKAAIAWEFRRRHRWGLLGLATYLVVLAAAKMLVLVSQHPIRLESDESFAFVVVIPISAALTYFLAVFSFGLDGDLAARRSMYPARLFTLPVSNSALAGWPMLYGTAAIALLWVAMRLLTLWPSDFQVPILWPALLAASLLAWTQALTWMPYGLRGARVLVAVLWLAAIDSVVLLALHFNSREPAMLAILAPQLPLAFFAARFAVARARRGEVPDWSGLRMLRAPFVLQPTAARAFLRPARAQAWFEWRRTGRSLPGWVAILLPFELALLWVSGGTPSLVFAILLGVLVTPPFMATFNAATVRASGSFIATRPLSDAALVAAKLRATVRSTLAAWILVLLAVPLALWWSGAAPVVVERFTRLSDGIGTPRTIVLLALVLVGLIATTWKQLVQSFYIGLTGRAWLIKGSVFVTLALLFFIGPAVGWISEHRQVEGVLWNALPAILAALVCAKMAAGAIVVTRVHRRRLLSERALVTGATAWCAAVLALYGVLVWFLSTPFFPRYVLALVAILFVPLARISAAPLALAWERHR